MQDSLTHAHLFGDELSSDEEKVILTTIIHIVKQTDVPTGFTYYQS